MGRHATRRRTRRSAGALPVALAVGAVVVGGGTVVLLQASPTATSPTFAQRADTPPAAVTLAIGGAVSFGGRTLPLLEDPAGPFPGTADVLQAADVALVDLVAPADGSTPPASAFAALARTGVDGIGRLDPRWSPAATSEVTAGLAAAGLGYGERWVSRTGPVAVSVLSTDGVSDRAGLLAGVAAADRAGDVVVVSIATAGDDCPDGGTAGLSAALVAAGADVVVGGVPPDEGGTDRTAVVLPGPGPLLVAADGGRTESEVALLRVGPDRVEDATTLPLRIDAFGRALPSGASAAPAPRCAPSASR